MRLRECAIGLALSLLQCTGHKLTPAAVQAPAIVELPSSSIKSLKTASIGNRVAFAAELCIDPKLLKVPVKQIWPVIESSNASPIARVARSFDPECTKPETLDAEQQAKCTQKSNCPQLFGIVDRAGNTLVQWVSASKPAKHAATVVAKITLDLPNPKQATDEGLLSVAENALSTLRIWPPSPFDLYWDARVPVVFPGEHKSSFAKGLPSEGDHSLFNPWLSSNHVLEEVGLQVLGGRLDPDQAATVPSEVILPWVADRKFDYASSAQVNAPEIVRYVPHDSAWVRFSDARKLSEVLDRFEDLGSNAALGLQQEGKDRRLRARYATELGLEEASFTRLFDDGLADDMALITHDLSLRDGTDVTAVVHLVPGKNGGERLRQLILGVGKGAGAVRSSITVRQRQGDLVRSMDAGVNSHLLLEGNWAIVSNSVVALGRVLDTSHGLRPSVAAERDYRYLRGLGDPKATGTLHLGAAFWGAQLSAAQRVEHRRRLICAGEMQALSSAMLAYRRDRGEPAKLDQLIAARYLLADDLRCPDGGNLTLENDAPHCTVHGTLSALSPVVEHLPRMIKPSERDGYREYFASSAGDDDESGRNRGDFGREFMIPLDVEFSVGKDFVAKARTLPDESSGLFTKLRSLFSTRAVHLASKATPPRTIASVTTAFDISDLQKIAGFFDAEEAEKGDYGPKGRLALDRWLTGEAKLLIGDGAPSISLPAEGVMGRSGFLEFAQLQLGMSAVATALTSPVSGVLPLKDVDLAREAIGGLYFKLGANVLLRGGVEGYQLVPYRDTVVYVLSVSAVNFHLYYAFIDKYLIFSNRKPAMLALIDQYSDKTATFEPAKSQALVELFPKQFDTSLEGVETAWQERLRRVCLHNLANYELLAQAHSPSVANDPTLARKYFGFDAKCPEGGHYLYDALEGGVYCTVHGHHWSPRQPTHLSQRAESSRLFRAMKYIGLSLATTEHTLEGELRIERE